MNEYGTLHEKDGRYALRFERVFPYTAEEVFRVITDPDDFVKWYPFATGNVDLSIGGKIYFDDGEGSQYEAVITELEAPKAFSFREVDDLIEISLTEEDNGIRMVYIHTFDDPTYAHYMAAGWHRCLDVLSQIINGKPIEWPENAEELRATYAETFGKA
ncbi:SRPBCC family protein [Alkalihalobacillus sp. TS-13]|uniref:SRPBCC family protein n=1 Tax=Alkalihalobacillus sp. TS-13 TaxID=2842455 RepID=UPI001C887C4D|nr:SRPBCC family protein [Alkalihalobacillus sp. TS-13]